MMPDKDPVFRMKPVGFVEEGAGRKQIHIGPWVWAIYVCGSIAVIGWNEAHPGHLVLPRLEAGNNRRKSTKPDFKGRQAI